MLISQQLVALKIYKPIIEETSIGSGYPLFCMLYPIHSILSAPYFHLSVQFYVYICINVNMCIFYSCIMYLQPQKAFVVNGPLGSRFRLVPLHKLLLWVAFKVSNRPPILRRIVLRHLDGKGFYWQEQVCRKLAVVGPNKFIYVGRAA